jgi:hypothetical protein
MGFDGYWWTATECKGCGDAYSAYVKQKKAEGIDDPYAVSWEMITVNDKSEAFERRDTDKEDGRSVRCVQD